MLWQADVQDLDRVFNPQSHDAEQDDQLPPSFLQGSYINGINRSNLLSVSVGTLDSSELPPAVLMLMKGKMEAKIKIKPITT